MYTCVCEFHVRQNQINVFAFWYLVVLLDSLWNFWYLKLFSPVVLTLASFNFPWQVVKFFFGIIEWNKNKELLNEIHTAFTRTLVHSSYSITFDYFSECYQLFEVSENSCVPWWTDWCIKYQIRIMCANVFWKLQNEVTWGDPQVRSECVWSCPSCWKLHVRTDQSPPSSGFLLWLKWP